MALLRRHYRTQVLALGAEDLAGRGSIFEALNRWSRLAARSVASALWIAAEALDLVSASRPATLGDQQPAGPGPLPLAVFGVGRLGLNEFDLASDAGLLFVAAPGASREELALWSRLAEKTVEVLSSYTRDGTLFAVDTRWRPRGGEGELVIAEDDLLGDVGGSAGVWELLTYLKAAPVAGDIRLGLEIASRLTTALLNRFASCRDLEGDLDGLQQRLEGEVRLRPPNPETAPGGYDDPGGYNDPAGYDDINFCLSYLRLRHHREGTPGAPQVHLPVGANTAEQIAALRAAGLVTEPDANALSGSAALLRSVDHAVRLVTGKPANGLPEHVSQTDSVESLVRRWGLLARGETLAGRVFKTRQEARCVCRRLVGSE